MSRLSQKLRDYRNGACERSIPIFLVVVSIKYTDFGRSIYRFWYTRYNLYNILMYITMGWTRPEGVSQTIVRQVELIH